jgi:tripartite ATP-independent transporter DctM subunit
MDTIYVGILGLVALFALLAVGVPIAFCLLGVSLLGLSLLSGTHAALSTITSASFNYIANYTMSVIPVFILMGVTGSVTGLLDEAFDVAKKWFGGFKAGDGIATIAANTFFSAASGSSLAACIVIGKGALPAMRKSGYPDTLAMGTIAASGTIATMIPPSIGMCIYGLLVDESIGKLLIAGIIPGIVEAFLYIGVVILGVRNLKTTVEEKSTIIEKILYTRHLWVIFIAIIAVMGTIYTGVCTPTEAGAIGAITVFILSLLLKRVTYENLKKILIDTIKTSGMVLFIIIAAGIFSRFLLLSGLTEKITEIVAGYELNRYIIFGLIFLCYLALGCFLTATGMMVISLPLFHPIMIGLGFDSVWFGIMVVTFCEMAVITPPLGLNVYVTQSLDSNMPLSTVFRGCYPFLMADTFRVILLTVLPSLALFLPTKML